MSMKTNKFFATALAVLALAGFTACDQPTPTEPLELTETSVTMKVGETHQLTANVAVESWTSSNEAVATVADGLVTAVSAGNAIISATAAGVTKTCVVLVEADQTQGGGATLKGSQFWPIAIDGTTADANASKIVGDFRPDDVGKFLYVWDATYVANDNPTGLNFHGNTDGFTALTVSTLGWAGCGYCLTETDASKAWEAAEALRAAIVASPDDYYLHMALKSTDKASHCFYIFGSEATKFVIGSTAVYDGPLYEDFTRNGEWAEFDIPMSRFATALATTTCAAGVNVFVALTEGTAGAQLNMDAIYFYKK
ncbi:MAG: Ig-like domain-containing protein [Paludibacteraceae bacterium]|nr:Ig-like domain-containing protein [Paludibacteraceae bacterium]